MRRVPKQYALIQSSQWSRSFVWMIDFQCHTFCVQWAAAGQQCSAVSTAVPGEEVMSVTEAQYSAVSHAATRYQKHWSTKLYKSHALSSVCMLVHSHVTMCMCFSGLTANAAGLINISVRHEATGAYRQWRTGSERESLMRSDRLCEHDSDRSLSATKPTL